MGTSPKLSIVLPAFNEEQRIGDTLLSVAAYLDAQMFNAEIIVVNDGSVDKTDKVVDQIADEVDIPIIKIGYPKNRGKGYALKRGFAASSGEAVLFTDADLASPINQLEVFLTHIETTADIAIGSRNLAASQITVSQPWYRVLMGKINIWLVRRIAIKVSDATCGFKLFRGDVGREIFAKLRVNGFGFDAEALFIAEQLGYRIREIPIRWENKPGTSVSVVRDTLDTLIGLTSIRWNAMNHRYKSSITQAPRSPRRPSRFAPALRNATQPKK